MQNNTLFQLAIVLCDGKLNIFGVMIAQNKQLEDITLGCFT